MNTRRKLLVALGAGALAAPFVSFAQQQGKVWRVGFLSAAPGFASFAAAFRQGLRELGYSDGKNILIELRSAEGKPGLLPGMAADLVRLKVDVIVAVQTPAVQAAKQATSAIPIVMAPAGDPVGTGLIASLARPGGNVTGVSNTGAELSAKNLEIIREILPSVRSMAILANATDPYTKTFLGQIELAGRTLGIKLQTFMIRGEEELVAAFAEMGRARVHAVIVQPSLPRQRAVDLALKHRLPAVSPSGTFAEAGGLMGYAANAAHLQHAAAVYVDKILKGAKPADLPVQQPTQFELVVNMKTAKALGLTIPQSILIRADKVIQ